MSLAKYKLYVADPADPTNATALVDFTSWSNGAVEGFGVIDDTLDFGSIATEPTWLEQPPWPGAIQAQRKHPVTQMTFNLYAIGSSQDSYKTMVRRLASALDREGVIVYQSDADLDPVFFDYLKSPIPNFVHGNERSMFKFLRMLQDPDGLPLSIWRQPYARMPLMNFAWNQAQNSLLLDSVTGTTPDLWVWGSTTGITNQVIDWGSQSFQWQMAGTAAREFTQTVNAGAAGDVWTASFDFFTGDFTIGQIKVIIEYHNSSDVLVGSRTTSATWVGTGDDFIRVFVTSGVAPAGTAKIKYGIVLANTSATQVTMYLRRAQLEKSSVPTGFRAGSALVTNDLSQPFTRHFWAFNPGNAPAMADVQITATQTTIGYWLGSALVGGAASGFSPGGLTNGAVSGDNYVLTAANSACGPPPTAGLNWGTAPHSIIYDFDQSAATGAFAVLRDITTGTDIWTAGSPTLAGHYRQSIGFTPLPGHLYQPQVRRSAGTVTVHFIQDAVETIRGVGLALTVHDEESNLTELANNSGARHIVDLGTVTRYTDSTVQVDGDAYNNDAVRTNFASNPNMARRVRWEIVPIDSTVFAGGTFDVWCSLRVDLATTVKIQMRYAIDGTDVASTTGPEIPLDMAGDNAPDTSIYTPVFMGTITLPDGVNFSKIAIEGWAGRDAGTGFLWWDTEWIVPADGLVTYAYVPTFNDPGGPTVDTGTDVWQAAVSPTGSAILQPATNPANGNAWGAGVLGPAGTRMQIDRPDEAVAFSPSGILMPEGTHTVTFDMSCVFNKNTPRMGECRIYDVTTPGSPILAASCFAAGSNKTDAKDRSYKLTFDSDGTQKFQAVVVFTETFQNGNHISVIDFQHTFVPLTTAQDTISIDGIHRIFHLVDSNGVHSGRMVPGGPFVELPSGLSLVCLDFWELAPSGYDSVDARGPLGRTYAQRVVRAGVNLIPRLMPA